MSTVTPAHVNRIPLFTNKEFRELRGMVLAFLGICGVISPSVAGQTREIGIGMAVGATAGAAYRPA